MSELRRLFELRQCYDPASAVEKLTLLRGLRGVSLRCAEDVQLLHTVLCFTRAFPDSTQHYTLASAELGRMPGHIATLCASQRHLLDDSGIAGTSVHYRFSYTVAAWLSRRNGQFVNFDWDDADENAGLDVILRQLMHAAEDEYFDGGQVSSREWLQRACANSGLTDFDWLLRQIQNLPLQALWAQLYDEADPWLTWDLRHSPWSVSNNRMSRRKVVPRSNGMRRIDGPVYDEIQRPVDSLRLLGSASGAKLIDVAMASLAARHRETYHFNFANPQEVYLANIGCGTSIAVFGLRQSHRFPLETTLGYLILSNGVPVGYGGSSALFRQINTGLNVFSEYRGSEAAFLFVQVMRVYHHLTSCTRFIANPYQLGAGNDEALKSGAFWTYYRLGYRPVDAVVRSLAVSEYRQLKKNRRYRSSLSKMRRLASCDMHLLLPGARDSEYFEERWIETSSRLASDVLDSVASRNRREASMRTVTKLARAAGIRALNRWTKAERRGLMRLAPIAISCEPSAWSVDERRSLRSLLRAKGGKREVLYARQLARHGRFLQTLRKVCRQAE